MLNNNIPATFRGTINRMIPLVHICLKKGKRTAPLKKKHVSPLINFGTITFLPITWGRGLPHVWETGYNFMGDVALPREGSIFLPRRK